MTMYTTVKHTPTASPLASSMHGYLSIGCSSFQIIGTTPQVLTTLFGISPQLTREWLDSITLDSIIQSSTCS